LSYSGPNGSSAERVGEVRLSDDAVGHEAIDPSDALRAALIVDGRQPDLSPAERLAVAGRVEASGARGMREGP
jgi:hypothetical protein